MNRNPTILLVDDNRTLTRLLAILLTSQLGASVHQAHSCQQARSIVEDFIPDVIVIDLVLPDGHGLTLAEEICKVGNTRVVIMSAEVSQDTILRAKARFGFVGVLQKPFESHDMIATLGQVLQLPKSSLTAPGPSEPIESSTGNRIGSLLTALTRTENDLHEVIFQLRKHATDEIAIRKIVSSQLEEILEDVFRMAHSLRSPLDR